MASPATQSSASEDAYRQAALAAFSHDIRSPLTAMQMVLEIAERTEDGGLVLDEELVGMLRATLDEFQRLADGLQELSRLERGLLRPAAGGCRLGGALNDARALVDGTVTLELGGDVSLTGPWNQDWLARAVAGLVLGANRMGGATGRAQLTAERSEPTVSLRIECGEKAADESVGVSADAGFGFFGARLLVLGMGGSVELSRHPGHCVVTAVLPADS